MILVIGEILVDIFPEYRRIGGAPFNFSYHLHRFGWPVKLVSRIGEDETGREILDLLRRHNFGADHVQVDAWHPTGRVLVHPDGSGNHEFEILPDVAYDHIDLPDCPEAITGNPPALIYFGTLVQRTSAAFGRLQNFLASRSPETRCLYDINLRPGCYNTEIVHNSLRQTDILKINAAEVTMVRDMLNSPLPEDRFIDWLMREYKIEMVSLTRGNGGSELITPYSRNKAAVPETGPVADSVGAGDAYAAVLAWGYLNDWTPERILTEASAFSARICQIQGAIPDDQAFYDSFIDRITGEKHA